MNTLTETIAKQCSKELLEQSIEQMISSHELQTDFFDESVLENIQRGRIPFIFSRPVSPQDYAGWKYTVVGTSIEDAIWLYLNIGLYLRKIDVPFKVGTKKLIQSGSKEQRVKLLTIYIEKKTKVDLLEKDLRFFLQKYKTTATLQYSEHVWGPLYKRADIDEYGNYIPADPSKNIK